jgi:hypothetical protein
MHSNACTCANWILFTFFAVAHLNGECSIRNQGKGEILRYGNVIPFTHQGANRRDILKSFLLPFSGVVPEQESKISEARKTCSAESYQQFKLSQ